MFKLLKKYHFLQPSYFTLPTIKTISLNCPSNETILRNIEPLTIAQHSSRIMQLLNAKTATREYLRSVITPILLIIRELNYGGYPK